MPISWAMKCGGFSAISSEMTMKNTMSTRITTTLRRSTLAATLSSIWPEGTSSNPEILSRKIMSSVIVELEVSTSDASVDIEAESTSSITSAISASGRPESICGMIESNANLPISEL